MVGSENCCDDASVGFEVQALGYVDRGVGGGGVVAEELEGDERGGGGGDRHHRPHHHLHQVDVLLVL